MQTLLGASLGEFSGMNVNTDGILSFLYLVFIRLTCGYTSYIMLFHICLSALCHLCLCQSNYCLFLGWIVLNEKMTIIIFAASLIIIAGVVLVKMGSDRQNNTSEEITEAAESI